MSVTRVRFNEKHRNKVKNSVEDYFYLNWLNNENQSKKLLCINTKPNTIGKYMNIFF